MHITVPNQTARGRSFPFAAAVLVVLGVAYLLGAGHTTPAPGVPTGLEVAASLLAAVVGLVALVRYYSRKELHYLFVGLGFLGVSLFDGLNAATLSPQFQLVSGGRLPAAAEWDWLAGRMFLALFLVLGWATWGRAPLHPTGKVEAAVFAGTALLAFGTLTIILSVDLPPVWRTEGLVARPLELIPAALFLVALLGHARDRAWRRDVFVFWSVLSLGVLTATQLLVAFSPDLVTAPFFTAHGAKLGAYVLIVIGSVTSMTQLFRTAEDSKREMAQMNARLTQEVERRSRAEQTLADEMGRLEVVLDSMVEGVAFIDRDGGVVRANPSVRQIFGQSIQRAGTDGCWQEMEVYHSDQTTPYHEDDLPVIRALEGETVREAVLWVVTAARAEGRYVRTNATPVLDQDGDVQGVVAVFRDVTEEQAAGETLRDREARLEAIVQTAKDAIISIDAESTIIEFNPAAERLFGWKKEEAVGQSVTRLMPAGYRDAHVAGVQRYLETGEARLIGQTAELSGLQRDGTEVPIELSLASWAAGEETGFTAIIRDIRTRKDAEERLRESEERYRILAENATDLIAVHESDGTLRYASPAAFSILQRTPEMLQGRRMQDFLIEEDQPLFGRVLQRAQESGETQDVTVRLPCPDGTILHIEAILRWLPPTNGRADGRILATYRDVTDKVRDRQALARSNEELQEFAFIASHDLKEPIRKIIAFGDRISSDYEGALGKRGNDYLLRMRSAAERMRTLLDDLLAYSRVTTKARPFEKVDLGALVADVVEDLGEQIRETAGQVKVGRLPVVTADPTQMRQLFQNLISNGLKYHREDVPPRIDIRGRKRSMEHVVSVEDNGIGFDMQYVDRIFRPFQRLHGRSEYPGSGMGLAIVRKIVERHDGNITAESTPGSGSRFTLVLPIREVPADEETSALEAPHHA